MAAASNASRSSLHCSRPHPGPAYSGRPLKRAEEGEEDAPPLLEARAAKGRLEVDDRAIIAQVLDVQAEAAVSLQEARAGREMQVEAGAGRALVARRNDAAGEAAAVIERKRDGCAVFPAIAHVEADGVALVMVVEFGDGFAGVVHAVRAGEGVGVVEG